MEYRFNTNGSINQDILNTHATIRKNEMDDPRKQQPATKRFDPKIQRQLTRRLQKWILPQQTKVSMVMLMKI